MIKRPLDKNSSLLIIFRSGHPKVSASISSRLTEVVTLRCLSLKIAIHRGGHFKVRLKKYINKDGHLRWSAFKNSYI